jgi:hypothetical protein
MDTDQELIAFDRRVFSRIKEYARGSAFQAGATDARYHADEVALAATMLIFGSEADAQKFPDRPTMIIPFAAGGPTDILGRVVRDE